MKLSEQEVQLLRMFFDAVRIGQKEIVLEEYVSMDLLFLFLQYGCKVSREVYKESSLVAYRLEWG